MRAAIARIPDGTYAFHDFVDDDGIERDRPLRIDVALTVAGDSVIVDLGGSSDQAVGPVNCTLNMSRSAVICGVMMALGADIPANAGCYRPVIVKAPEGLVVNARSPAPVASWKSASRRQTVSPPQPSPN